MESRFIGAQNYVCIRLCLVRYCGSTTKLRVNDINRLHSIKWENEIIKNVLGVDLVFNSFIHHHLGRTIQCFVLPNYVSSLRLCSESTVVYRRHHCCDMIHLTLPTHRRLHQSNAIASTVVSSVAVAVHDAMRQFFAIILPVESLQRNNSNSNFDFEFRFQILGKFNKQTLTCINFQTFLQTIQCFFRINFPFQRFTLWTIAGRRIRAR